MKKLYIAAVALWLSLIGGIVYTWPVPLQTLAGIAAESRKAVGEAVASVVAVYRKASNLAQWEFELRLREASLDRREILVWDTAIELRLAQTQWENTCSTPHLRMGKQFADAQAARHMAEHPGSHAEGSASVGETGLMVEVRIVDALGNPSVERYAFVGTTPDNWWLLPPPGFGRETNVPASLLLPGGAPVRDAGLRPGVK